MHFSVLVIIVTIIVNSLDYLFVSLLPRVCAAGVCVCVWTQKMSCLINYPLSDVVPKL